MSIATFRSESLMEVLAHVRAQLASGAEEISFRVIDPDVGRGRYAGELVEWAGEAWVHRSFRVWVDLAERLGLRLRTPRAVDDGIVELRFERLDPKRRLGTRPARPSGPAGPSGEAGGDVAAETERYGAASGFARISKLEEPGFLIDFEEAIERAALGPAPRILDLGVNTGDELVLLARLTEGARCVGVDHSASALETARRRLGEGVRWIEGDVNAIGGMGLGRFDLVVSLNTLHSPGIDDREVLRRIVQDHLEPRGAVIIGFPSSRYIDGELEYGARMKNFRQPELGLMVKDVAFYRKYLQQHHRKVYVTGKHYVLVTGVWEGGES